MADSAENVPRRSFFIKVLIVAAVGCGGGESVVTQSGNKLQRLKGADKNPQALPESKKQ